jgi:hypothetical protein
MNAGEKECKYERAMSKEEKDSMFRSRRPYSIVGFLG